MENDADVEQRVLACIATSLTATPGKRFGVKDALAPGYSARKIRKSVVPQVLEIWEETLRYFEACGRVYWLEKMMYCPGFRHQSDGVGIKSDWSLWETLRADVEKISRDGEADETLKKVIQSVTFNDQYVGGHCGNRIYPIYHPGSPVAERVQMHIGEIVTRTLEWRQELYEKAVALLESRCKTS